MTGDRQAIQESGEQAYSPSLVTGTHWDIDESVTYTLQLAQRIKASGFEPDLVVGIREGGILPARVLAEALGTPAQIISVRRRASGVKHLPLVRLIGRRFGNQLVRFGMVRRVLNMLNRLPGRSVEPVARGPVIDPSMSILVVDDFSCSGETFVAAIAWLREAGATPDSIRTAALIASPDPKRGTAFYPTYMLASVPWLFFPWSSNSPHYGAYLQWKATRGL